MLLQNYRYTVKKGLPFPTPQPGIINLFPVRESLVCDFPTGDGKIANLFLRCICSGFRQKEFFPFPSQSNNSAMFSVKFTRTQ
jgi:hypothetical protein